jgi:hypothetical protein
MNDIDRVLRDDARTNLPDEGFTARVMGALPARAPAQSGWLTPALVFGSAALGSVLAIVFAPAGSSVLQGFADLVQLRGFTPAAVTAAAMGVALLASALVLAVETD